MPVRTYLQSINDHDCAILDSVHNDTGLRMQEILKGL